MTKKSTTAPRAPAQRSSGRNARIALAFAGGGPLGAIYEVGALCALEESLPGLQVNACDHYLGVSAGGFIAAGLANGMTPRQLCASFIEDHANAENFDPAGLMKPAWSEWIGRLQRLPGLIGGAAWAWGVQGKPFTQALERLGAALPTGVFDNEEIHLQVERLFSRDGRTNDFRQLRTRLTLIATELDTGEAAPFGRPGWDHVPISRAIQASSALPGLFPPVDIDGRHFVDGALKKTLHATVALDDGVDLLLCLNPLVPFHADPEAEQHQRIPSLIEGGLPAVMSQTFRSMIHSRLALGLKHYERAYPDTDIVLIEPDQRDAKLFFANTFSYRQRRDLAEHAYQQTRALLRERKDHLGPRLARHGISLDMAALNDPSRRLLKEQTARPTLPALQRLHDTLDELQSRLEPQPGKA